MLALVGGLALLGCKVTDPLFCDEGHPCTDPARPFCDVAGTYPASEGIGKTCIPDPSGAAADAGEGDAAPPGLDAAVAADAGPCSWSRLAPLANVNRPDDAEFLGSIDADGRTLYFARSDEFFRAERLEPDQPFGGPEPLDFDPMGFLNPEVSASGLELFYADFNEGTIGRATRTTLGAGFRDRDDAHLQGISPSLSGDGLSLYHVSRDKVYRVTRPSIDAAWGERELVIDSETLFFDVDVSPDELRLLLVANPLAVPVDPLFVAERSSVDVDFGEPVPIDPAILFPDSASYAYASWTGDGRQIVVSVSRDSENDLHYATCE